MLCARRVGKLSSFPSKSLGRSLIEVIEVVRQGEIQEGGTSSQALKRPFQDLRRMRRSFHVYSHVFSEKTFSHTNKHNLCWLSIALYDGFNVCRFSFCTQQMTKESHRWLAKSWITRKAITISPKSALLPISFICHWFSALRMLRIHSPSPQKRRRQEITFFL